VLTSHHIVDETQIATLQAEVEREIEAAVEFAKASPKPNAAALMEDVYA
jgi:pyruvate dehydrogenase E1 component alpha subunit